MGFRGRAGELTLRVASGHAGRWVGLRRVLIAPGAVGEGSGASSFEVESIRAYADRLVLKLCGVDGPDAADSLRGRLVLVPPEEVPQLPEGMYFVARLVGLEVRDEQGRSLGRVADVESAGGSHVLVVRADTGGEEVLIPLVREMILEIHESEGRVTVRLPEGLVELNRTRETP